jgi:hypothetical protein
MLSPLTASSLRIKDRLQLEEFLAKPEARNAIRSASFEEVFFVIKHIGLADTLDLLPIVTGRQVRGFIDLDCWRKDTFVRKPFMEWVAAFVQVGPEETAKALSGIDDVLLALFLKDLVRVYEVERDDPPDVTQLISTPDERFAVEPLEEGEASTIGMLILDALFKYNPHLGTQVLTLIRYTSRLELEETAFDNKTRRLEVHGFVDYYDALSIYSGPGGEGASAAGRDDPAEDPPGEELPGKLPAVFADSLNGGEFLLKALEFVTNPAESERLAQELTALGNRILSANLVNLGELEGIRPALEEMRDTLTVGLEYLTDRHPERGPAVLRKSYIQTVFKVGFDRMAGLRDRAEALVAVPRFRVNMLDMADREFLEGLRRFKPLVIEDGRLSKFPGSGRRRSCADPFARTGGNGASVPRRFFHGPFHLCTRLQYRDCPHCAFRKFRYHAAVRSGTDSVPCRRIQIAGDDGAGRAASVCRSMVENPERRNGTSDGKENRSPLYRFRQYSALNEFGLRYCPSCSGH